MDNRIDIQKSKNYGLLAHVRSSGLDVEKYEEILMHFNSCLDELQYPDNIKLRTEFWSEKSIVIVIETEDKKYSIDLVNFVKTRDNLFSNYTVSVTNSLNDLLAIMELTSRFDPAGYESVRHDKKTDHVYYCLKALKYFI